MMPHEGRGLALLATAPAVRDGRLPGLHRPQELADGADRAAGTKVAGALINAVTGAGYQAAVPATVRADDVGRRRAAQATELRTRRISLAAGAVLSAAVLVVAYGFSSAAWAGWAQLALTLPVYVWTGAVFHRGAIEAARHHTSNMDTLVSLGATVAFGYSVIATIALPSQTTYYDVAALIITLIAVGKYLELTGRARAGAAIEALAELQPRTAHLIARAARTATSRPPWISRSRPCAPATQHWCARAKASRPTASWPTAPAWWTNRC
jgi:cation transport ATPase